MSDTVTISLETYEGMKDEINSLKKKVEEKTIEVLPDWYHWLLFLTVIAFFVVIISKAALM